MRSFFARKLRSPIDRLWNELLTVLDEVELVLWLITCALGLEVTGPVQFNEPFDLVVSEVYVVHVRACFSLGHERIEFGDSLV